tara:strand:+ start:374 stop:922 length:549 start_codon:yes stop_codon:yes gene_type:complete
MNIFLRHGEVQNPKDILYYNIPGYELSELGKAQAEYAAEVLANDFKIEQIISSPLLRARQTSEIVRKKLKMELSISEKITEWDGLLNWKGYTFNEISKTNEYLIYKEDPTKLDTNETFFETFQRVDDLYKNSKDTLFVTHQDTIRSFMFYKLKSDRFNQDKPGHCDLQYIENDILQIYTNPV